MRAKLIAANWKMNGSFALIDEMLKVLSPLVENPTGCFAFINEKGF